MKTRLTYADIDKVCDMALDLCGSYDAERYTEESREVQRIRLYLKRTLRFARAVRDGKPAFSPDQIPECV